MNELNRRFSHEVAKTPFEFRIASETIESMRDGAIGSSSSASRNGAEVTEADLKFMIALLNYALFSCPVDGGIEMSDGTTGSRAMIEDLKKRL